MVTTVTEILRISLAGPVGRGYGRLRALAAHREILNQFSKDAVGERLQGIVLRCICGRLLRHR
jgi:hypothetical protein